MPYQQDLTTLKKVIKKSIALSTNSIPAEILALSKEYKQLRAECDEILTEEKEIRERFYASKHAQRKTFAPVAEEGYYKGEEYLGLVKDQERANFLNFNVCQHGRRMRDIENQIYIARKNLD